MTTSEPRGLPAASHPCRGGAGPGPTVQNVRGSWKRRLTTNPLRGTGGLASEAGRRTHTNHQPQEGHMNHFQEAEDCLLDATEASVDADPADIALMLQFAQVHATLALVQAAGAK